MFILHSSNKTENLLAHLITVITNAPLSHPLTSETFLIQDPGIERWLSQQLTSHFGVWANSQFLFSHKFFTNLATKIDYQLSDSVFSREIMLWRLEKILRDIDSATYPLLHQYLSNKNQPIRRYQLACQLTQVFDQYQIMRPDMLMLWQQGRLLYQTDTERWQCALWQTLTQSADNKHRGSLWQAVIDKLNQSEEGLYTDKFPERIFIFGLNTLPPLFLDYLQGLSRHCDIHLFLLDPVQNYWADWANKQYRTETDVASHPLLDMLGKQGREFQQMILEQAHFTYRPESYQSTPVHNNLLQLQNDILANHIKKRTLSKDNTISIHSCHSRMREVEVLKDQLLNALENDPVLELREIIVMAPNIQDYAPFIGAVFNDIQHAIADCHPRLSNPALGNFIRFLTVSQSRFGWQRVMDVLEQPLVLQKFSISDSDLELIQHWVPQMQTRWGKSATHKKELGLPELSQNTWQATLNRLLMGYAVGNDTQFIDNVLPYPDIEGASALALGKFNDFIQLLFKASEECKRATSLSQWHTRLYYYAEQLLLAKTTAEQSQQQQLYVLLQGLVEPSQHHAENVTVEVILAWLESRLSESPSANGFLRGQLTFCSMLPMRSIPFKIIALLGINAGEFPKIDHHSSFDLIKQHFRKGDRCRRSDDRYQFLEIILSARQQLLITYIGQSIHYNNDIPPSVVISELLDVLENHYQLSNVVCKHPLQAFSSRYFDNQTELFSYSQHNCKTAIALQNNPPKIEPWWQGKLETEVPTTIDISALFNFYRQPQHYFFKQQLGLTFSEHSAQIEEREPFTLDPLTAYTINQQWIAQRLAGKPFPLKRLQAQGIWLSGTSGELAYQHQQSAIEHFITEIKQQNLGARKETVQIDVSIGQYRLMGRLANRYDKGSLIYRYSTLKGKDFMQSWLHHLVINQLQAQNTHLLAIDETVVFSDAIAQTDHLEQLINIFLYGLQQPNAFFTESSFAYINQAAKLKQSSRTLKSALLVAEEKLLQEISYDAYMRQLYQNSAHTGVLNPDFEAQCQQLLLPVWESVQ